MEEEQSLDEKQIMEQSWRKIECSRKMEGFREGAQEGKEQLFQFGFDAGYTHGFKAAKCLSSYNGFLKIAKFYGIIPGNTSKIPKENVKEGLCDICDKCGTHIPLASVDEECAVQKEKISQALKDKSHYRIFKEYTIIF